MPITFDTRSPRASSRSNCACTSPSLRASAVTLSRTFWSWRSISSRVTKEITSVRTGIWITPAARTVRKENIPDIMRSISTMPETTISGVPARERDRSRTRQPLVNHDDLHLPLQPVECAAQSRGGAQCLVRSSHWPKSFANAPEAARLLARWEATQRAARSIAPVCRSLASGFDPLVPGRCELRDRRPLAHRVVHRAVCQAAPVHSPFADNLERGRDSSVRNTCSSRTRDHGLPGTREHPALKS